MDSTPCSLAEVMAALARGTTVLTGNQRAARTLQSAYRRSQQQAGQHTWQSPGLLAWDAWTASLWQRLLQTGGEERLLLNAAQERLLWREVIAKDDALATLRSAESLAGIAAGAWTRLSHYGGRDRLRRMASTADTQSFATWAEIFERRCRTGGLLPAAQLESELRLAVQQDRLKITGDLLLVGFESLTPAQRSLLDALGAASVSIQLADLQQTESPAENIVAAAASEQDELHAGATWARAILQQSPESRIAILVPDLSEERTEIERVLRSVLAPELHDISASSPPPYEFSLGAPLSTYPMAATAIDLLRWTLAPLPIERVGLLLLSPYCGSQDSTERNTRAEFDAFSLRQMKLLQPELSLQAMQHALQKRPQLSGAARQLAAMSQLTDDRGVATTRKLGYGEWMEHVRGLLRAAGWPGTRTLDSIEFQFLRKWESVLDQVATLDFIGRPVPFAEAVAELEKTLAETTFAPQSHGAPVQVMGVLESAGSLFDAVWLLRGADGTWPALTGPHPLLPWQLQRMFHMPGVDLVLAQQDARRTIQRIRQSAPRVVFSYAREGKDGPQRRSAVIAELGWTEREAASGEPVSPPVPTELIPDDEPLPPLPDEVLRGGESVLRLQAACAFRAFAERRLSANTLDSVTVGMDPRQWGVLLHDAIRRFWAEVKTQHSLRAMSSADRDAVITASINAALNETPAAGSTWEEAYLTLQRQRLHSLISSWLSFELSRKPFEVLLSEKAFTDIRVGPLRLGLRVDRIDQVEDGEVLIDYKTGQSAARGWSGPRPDEPQLPLYAAFARQQPLQAIAFAKLRAGNQMKLDGYDAGNGALPLKAIDMEAMLADWREVLVHLAEDFADGCTDIAPKDYPRTCQYCSQRLLCRLDTSLLLQEIEDDAEDSVE